MPTYGTGKVRIHKTKYLKNRKLIELMQYGIIISIMEFSFIYFNSYKHFKIFFIVLFFYGITLIFIFHSKTCNTIISINIGSLYYTNNNNSQCSNSDYSHSSPTNYAQGGIISESKIANVNNHNYNNVSNYLKLPDFDNFDIEIVKAINQGVVNQSIKSTIDKVTALSQLSSIIQKQVKSMETVTDCSQTTTLLCGHQDVCGFGCQVHHRMACVMLSYVLGIPLIHERGGWPYSLTWNAVFERIGSKCSPGPKTLKVRWRRKNEKVTNNLITGNISLLSKSHTCKYNCTKIEYPFRHGIVVPELIGNVVDSLHDNPFAWWMGQFSKYVLRLKSNIQINIQSWKDKIFPKNQSFPLIGMHIRRTDKASETRLLPIEAYFKEAKRFNLSKSQNVSTRNVFIASDASHEILAEAKRKYNSSQWNILGFENQKTIKSQARRRNALGEIIRDIYLLSECDYVICTMSSQVCRVVLEIMSSKRINSFSSVKSLDRKYGFGLCCGFAVQPVVIKV